MGGARGSGGNSGNWHGRIPSGSVFAPLGECHRWFAPELAAAESSTVAADTRRQRLPRGDDPSALPRLGIVRDARKQTAQLHGGREFTTLLEGGTDGCGFRFGDSEHHQAWGSGYRPASEVSAPLCEAACTQERNARGATPRENPIDPAANPWSPRFECISGGMHPCFG
jgi:hypothetical protein